MDLTTSHNGVDPITPKHPKNKQTTKYTLTPNLETITHNEEQVAEDPLVTSYSMLKIVSYNNFIPLTTQSRRTLPDGSVVKSTHTCNLYLPHLPEEDILSYIVSNLQ